MNLSVSPNTVKLITRILGILVLVLALLFILTWTSTVKCKSVPFWCNAYYFIMGKPEALIVYGDSGLGDPDLLADALRNPNLVGVYAPMLHIDSVNPGNLKDYQLVIVDRCKEMSSAKIKMFLDYANTGGNLVWTGDSGTEAENEEDFLREGEYSLDSNSSGFINPWARKYDGRMVMLNKVLSVNYKTNYCDLKDCHKENEMYVGMLNPVSRKNALVYGFSPIKLEIIDGWDFAIVEPLSEGTSTTIMTIDFGSNLVEGETNYGNNLPIIMGNAKSSVVGWKIGENVFYYAIPPENFLNPYLPEEKHYGLFVRNMYNGIIYG